MAWDFPTHLAKEGNIREAALLTQRRYGLAEFSRGQVVRWSGPLQSGNAREKDRDGHVDLRWQQNAGGDGGHL